MDVNNKPDLNQFIEWVKQGQGTRTVEIRIGATSDSNYLEIWVYDMELKAGQFVKSVDNINLTAKKEAAERAEYNRLKAKFENEGVQS